MTTSTPHDRFDNDLLRDSLGGDWELVVKSKSLRNLAWICVGLIMALHIFMGVVVDMGDYTGAAITTLDKFAFPLIGMVFCVAPLQLLRTRVRVNSRGVEICNFLAPHFYLWDDIHGLSFPEKARHARLELPDFEFVPMWAMQKKDGEAVVKAVRRFRELEERYMPEE